MQTDLPVRTARRPAGHEERVRFGSVVIPGGGDGGFLVKDAGNDLHAHAICGWHQLAALRTVSNPQRFHFGFHGSTERSWVFPSDPFP